MNRSSRILLLLAAGAVLAGLGGCATIPADAGKNPADPFERVNREVFALNDAFDRAIAKPVAQGYSAVVPKPMRECVGNFFYNVGEVGNIVNATLQLKPADLTADVGRLLINSTFGLVGCFDVATKMGIERNRTYFGLTLARWGVPAGPYVVLPFLGPDTVRDTFGEVGDYFTDPVTFIKPNKDSWFVYTARFIDRRAQYLDASNLIDNAALDPYAFTRDAYLQRLQSRTSNGEPPPPPEVEDPDSPAPAAPAAPAVPVPPTAPSPSPDGAPQGTGAPVSGAATGAASATAGAPESR